MSNPKLPTDKINVSRIFFVDNCLTAVELLPKTEDDTFGVSELNWEIWPAAELLLQTVVIEFSGMGDNDSCRDLSATTG